VDQKIASVNLILFVLALSHPLARAEEAAGPPPCLGCCGTRKAEAHAEPKLHPGLAKFLGAAAGVGLGVALGRGSSPGGTRGVLTPLRTTDALVTGGALALFLSPRRHDAAARSPSAATDCAQDARVNAFDRELRDLALGHRSLEKRELLDRLSWTTLTASLAQPVGLIVSGDARHNWSRDLPVWGEAAAVSIAVDQAVKHLVHRRRPYARFCEPQRSSDLCTEDARLSFYSGHTSAAFVAAVAAGTLADFHHLPHRRWVWASGLTLATATGALRVTADKHYATDVLAGAAAGAVAGWLIPRLHKPDPASPAAPTAARGYPGPQIAIPLALRTGKSAAFVSAGVARGGRSLQLKWQW
jgi:hypothetical protein